MNVADPISRNPELQKSAGLAFLRVLTRSAIQQPLRERIAAATAADEWFKNPTNTANYIKNSDGTWSKNETSRDPGKPYKVLVVPNDASLKHEIVKMHHDDLSAGHMGRKKT